MGGCDSPCEAVKFLGARRVRFQAVGEETANQRPRCRKYSDRGSERKHNRRDIRRLQYCKTAYAWISGQLRYDKREEYKYYVEHYVG